MKRLLTLLAFVLSCYTLFGQTVFDITIDELYLDDSKLVFINNGETNTYLCELTPRLIKDYKHEIILECEMDNDWMWSDKPIKITSNEILKFDEPNQLLEHIHNRKFAKSTNESNKIHNSFLQYYNDHLFAKVNFKNRNDSIHKWKFFNVMFWDYVFIRINSEQLIIALVYENDPRPAGFIIPLKDEILVVTENFTYKEAGEAIDTIKLDKYIPLADFYRIKKQSNSLNVVDKLFQEKIHDNKFDEITFEENHINCKIAGKTEIYSKSFEKINIDNLKIAYDTLGSIQCIINNQLKWIDSNWDMHDTFPRPSYGLCGTISSTERKIEKKSNKFYESYISGYDGQKVIKDSILIIDDLSIKEVTYLTNEYNSYFDEYSNMYSVFSYPHSFYILTKEHKKQLVSITNRRIKKTRELIRQRDHYRMKSNPKKDSINILIGNLIDEMEVKIHYSGEFEAYGYNHPIKFKNDGLYGYYPMNNTAKYKRVGKFNFFFAEFEDTSGRLGWIDIYGNEYYK